MSAEQQIAYNIKFFREQKSWTQQKLADLLMVSRPTVTKWENIQLTPDIQNLVRLSEIFDVTLDYLVGNNLDRRDLLLDFKRIYASNSISFDDEAVGLVEYIMRFPDFKQQVHRLEKLSIAKQISIHKLIVNIIDEYEKL